MPRWAVIFDDDPEMLSFRAEEDRRNAHVAYAKAHPELLIGGGLKTDIEADFCGALWIVEAENKGIVEQLIFQDPFYISDFRRFKIYAWGKLLEDQQAIL